MQLEIVNIFDMERKFDKDDDTKMSKCLNNTNHLLKYLQILLNKVTLKSCAKNKQLQIRNNNCIIK